MPEELTDAQIATLHTALVTLKAELTHSLSDTVRAQTVELDQSTVGRLSRMDAMQQQAMAQAERRMQAQRLDAVDAALERYDDDEYGWCCQCGEPIAIRRLTARPESPFCVPCQTKLEA
jgi:DnaK suppressor protein